MAVKTPIDAVGVKGGLNIPAMIFRNLLHLGVNLTSRSVVCQRFVIHLHP